MYGIYIYMVYTYIDTSGKVIANNSDGDHCALCHVVA